MAGIHHAPPPFFKRGPAPLALLTFYVAISLALFTVDLRFRSLETLRQGLAVVIDPVQRAAQTPGSLIDALGGYLQGLHSLQAKNRELEHRQLNTAPDLQRLAHLEAENAHLRQLLGVRERERARGQIAHILYTARDPFARKVIVDKGEQQGIVRGQPAIDDTGVVGQVTRVFPFSAEVTLITDKDQAIPVQIVRNGLRSVVFGLGNGQLELRYMPANADVEVGDTLVTSGLDSVFLGGFPVARVVAIERENAYSFAKITCVPLAGVENHAELMILDPRQALPERPPEARGRGSDGSDGSALRSRKKRTLKAN